MGFVKLAIDVFGQIDQRTAAVEPARGIGREKIERPLKAQKIVADGGEVAYVGVG